MLEMHRKSTDTRKHKHSHYHTIHLSSPPGSRGAPSRTLAGRWWRRSRRLRESRSGSVSSSWRCCGSSRRCTERSLRLRRRFRGSFTNNDRADFCFEGVGGSCDLQKRSDTFSFWWRFSCGSFDRGWVGVKNQKIEMPDGH